MDQGIAQGTHAALMAARGVYWGWVRELFMFICEPTKRHQYRLKLIFFITLFFLSISIPLKAYVQANKYILAGTTSHWGVDVSWFIQDITGVEKFKHLLDSRENGDLLKTLKRFNDAILFVIHPDVIVDNQIDPKIATFATELQLTQIAASLAAFPNCSFRQITLGSDLGKSNVFIVFIFGYSNEGVWPNEIVESCIKRIRENVLP